MSTSSAGLNCAVPPQTKHPPSFSTTVFISSEESVTLVSTSIVSAVPAGEVIAREDVFGIVSPYAATMATTNGVVLLPGNPPMQCLSTTISLFQFSCFPEAIIAFVRSDISSISIRSPAQAVINAERWMLE